MQPTTIIIYERTPHTRVYTTPSWHSNNSHCINVGIYANENADGCDNENFYFSYTYITILKYYPISWYKWRFSNEIIQKFKGLFIVQNGKVHDWKEYKRFNDSCFNNIKSVEQKIYTLYNIPRKSLSAKYMKRTGKYFYSIHKSRVKKENKGSLK